MIWVSRFWLHSSQQFLQVFSFSYAVPSFWSLQDPPKLYNIISLFKKKKKRSLTTQVRLRQIIYDVINCKANIPWRGQVRLSTMMIIIVFYYISTRAAQHDSICVYLQVMSIAKNTVHAILEMSLQVCFCFVSQDTSLRYYSRRYLTMVMQQDANASLEQVMMKMSLVRTSCTPDVWHLDIQNFVD